MTKGQSDVFDLAEFLPYILNQAAEATSRSFQPVYSEKYGMTRTQWRVIANVGKFGAMTAKQICDVSHLEKTKVSRAILALEDNGLLMRKTSSKDRRAEVLTLTKKGANLFEKLGREAINYDATLRQQLGEEEARMFMQSLQKLIAVNTAGRSHQR
jgi:DNA-binding MarR family transcriptional regulator